MNISIIGGDLRIIKLAEMYAEENNVVYTYGLEKYFENNTNNKNIILCKNLKEAITNSKYIISSIPFTKDKINLNSPFTNNNITIEDLKNKVFDENGEKIFLAGGIPLEYYHQKKENKIDNIELVDLLEIEELTILNAIPTVEGTVKIAINEREETIHESNVLVCGFGRIGKILCDRFSKLGANIYCTARKDTDFAWIREKRYIPLKYSELQYYLNKIDIAINTVPHIVLGKEQLDLLNKDTLIIDLASSPGGVDTIYAKEIGLNAITALGIPGKEMPKTAAKYIKKIIDNIINQKKI